MADRLGYRPELDGLRAIAATAVVLAHMGVAGSVHAAGWGVDAFFTLSGFLITYLLVAELERSGRIALRAFWGRRARRLLPAMVAVVAACVPLLPWLGTDRSAVLSSLTYTSNWARAGGSDLGILGHTWSLSVEEQFYLAWPLLLLALLRLGRRFATLACIGAAISVAIVREAAAGSWAEHRIDNGTDMRADLLLWGCALGLAFSADRVPRWVGDKRTQVGALTVLAVAFVVGPPGDFLVRGFIGLTTCAVIAGVLTERTAPALSWRPLRWLGVRSYGLYLWHYPVAVLLVSTSWVVMTVPVSLVLAAASYRWIERPFLRQRLDDDVAVHPQGRDGRVVHAVLGGERR